VGHEFYRLLNSSTGFWDDDDLPCLTISPIVHPRRWDLDDPELTRIYIPLEVLESGVHPLLAFILAPRVPQICLETTLFFLRYLQSGGHSVKTRKSLRPLLKSRYFTRLKMLPLLSRIRKRQHPSNGHCLLRKEHLCSAWWASRPERPINYKNRIRVPFRFFSYRSEYASNYDIWCTYRHALRLLPFFLANAPPDFQLASIASDCIFNSFCTAHPRETRKAKKSITQYLSRRRPIGAIPSATRSDSGVHGINTMDVD